MIACGVGRKPQIDMIVSLISSSAHDHDWPSARSTSRTSHIVGATTEELEHLETLSIISIFRVEGKRLCLTSKGILNHLFPQCICFAVDRVSDDEVVYDRPMEKPSLPR